ncbi:MAG TPA: DUF5325 family protein [Bacillota bacterium]|nr:DUF5325 family protein [Bacillota bacterium]
MKKIHFPFLLLATLIILLFFGVGVAIAWRNVWLIFLLALLGFSFMGLGLSLKQKRQ